MALSTAQGAGQSDGCRRHRMLHASPIAMSTLPPSTPPLSPPPPASTGTAGTAWQRHRCAAARQPRHPRAHPRRGRPAPGHARPQSPGEQGKRPVWLRLLLQFHNVLIYVMLVAAVVTAALGHWLDTGVLLGAVVINALIGYMQEGKAESSLDAIRCMLSLQATCCAAACARWWMPKPGAGRCGAAGLGPRYPPICASCTPRACGSRRRCLTGESPARDSTRAVAEDAPGSIRYGMLYRDAWWPWARPRGWSSTGSRTELGRISALLSTVEATTTPLLRQMDRLGHRLALVITSALSCSPSPLACCGVASPWPRCS